MFKPGTNIQELKIICKAYASFEEVLPVFERWQKLRRLTLKIRIEPFPLVSLSSGPVVNSIKKMKHLTLLHLADVFVTQDVKALREKVKEVIVPERPYFTLNLCKLTK